MCTHDSSSISSFSLSLHRYFTLRVWAAQTETGYRLEAVTTRKLEFENDAFAFGDKVVEKWYGTVEQGDKKGILVVVTTGKDGALTGGPAFMKVRPPGAQYSDQLPGLAAALLLRPLLQGSGLWAAPGKGGVLTGGSTFVRARQRAPQPRP